MEKYEKPNAEVIEIEKEDVILTSTCVDVYSCPGTYTPPVSGGGE